MNTAARVLLILSLGLVALPVAADCKPVDGISSICGLQNPEDLEVLPGDRFIVFSQMVEGAGLALLDTADDSVRPLYPGGAVDPAPGWGDADCRAEPGEDILAHGIHLRRRQDGRLQLLVVNHGGRESVEFFELMVPLAETPVLVWRGCVEAPDDAYLNDVVGLPDGGFLVTHMFSRSAQAWEALKALLGSGTGHVYRWDSSEGFSIVPGTGVAMANGIAVSADDQYFFLNVYIGGEVRKYPLAGGEPLAVVEVPSPDNSAWDSSGRLLVASHLHSLTGLLDATPNDDGSPIALRFAIVAIDPDTLETEILLEREGPPMGGATVAVEAAGNLYMGTYAGDRIIKFPMTISP